MDQPTKRTQIAFDVSLETRKLIKMIAIRRNISMNLWLSRVIYTALVKEGMIEVENKTTK